MKNTYTERLTINDTEIDFEAKVPVTELMRLIEVATFNHSDKIGLDHDTMEERDKAFWVVSKIKMKFKGDVHSQDRVTVKTWTQTPGMIRFTRFCTLKVRSSVKVLSSSEWCCLDYDSRKLRKASTIKYPDLEMEETKELDLKYSNLKMDVDESDYVYTKKVRSTDIDINNHTNNLKYNFIAMDALDIGELKAIDMKEYEIYFVNESKYGDEIRVYKKKVKDYIYIEGKIEDKSVFRVVIKYKKRKI